MVYNLLESDWKIDERPRMNSIRLAALLGHEKVLEWMLQSNKYGNINESDNRGMTALMWASEFGHEITVKMLLDRGADVNAQGGAICQCPTSSITGWSRDDGADAARSRGGRQCSRRNLWQCPTSSISKWSRKVVQMLLDKRADVNAKGGVYGNALQAASVGGHDMVVQMLLDKQANVNAKGGFYGTALQAASAYGHRKVVQMLLDKRADINAQGGKYGNALQAALYRGDDMVVQILLDRGADVNAQGGFYGNALQAASAGGNEKMVQMLLDRGSEVNTQGGFYGNALQAASRLGHDMVVQMLLDRGAVRGVNVTAHEGGGYRNALLAAPADGHEKGGADAARSRGRYQSPRRRRWRCPIRDKMSTH